MLIYALFVFIVCFVLTYITIESMIKVTKIHGFKLDVIVFGCITCIVGGVACMLSFVPMLQSTIVLFKTN